MKKILLGTTGLVAAAVLASSPAAALDVSVGGFAKQWVGFVDSDDATGNWDQQSNTEVFFNFSGTADNGLTFGGKVELEADQDDDSGDDTIDASYIYVMGESFGTLQLGAVGTFTDGIHRGGGDVGYGVGDTGDWTDIGVGGHAVDPGGDLNKVQYVSPSFAGFKIGGFVNPNGDTKGDSTPSEGESAWGVGLDYSADYNGVAVGFDAAYGVYEDSYKQWALGLSVAASGFRVGGGYGVKDYDGGGDDKGWEVGASYSSGPAAVSISWRHKDAMGFESDAYMLSGSYNLMAGVDAKASIFKDEDDSGDEGVGVVGGLAISF